MTGNRDFLNVPGIALALTAGPLALLLLFAALDMSWSRVSSNPNKGSVATELAPTAQPASMQNR